MRTNNGYIGALKQRLQELKDALEKDRLEARRLLDEIGEKEKKLGYICQLLSAEGVPIDGGGLSKLIVMSPPDAAYDILQKQGEQKSMHYRELANRIVTEGGQIPGQNPGANLIAHMVRDKRFVRTGRGMYALAEWGLEPARKRGSRRRARSKRS